MTAPLIYKFTCTAGEDLFDNTTIRTHLTNQFGSSILDSIDKGNAGMVLTVFVDSTTQISLKDTLEWNDFIKDIVYSSNGVIYPKHCYIKNAVSGTLSIQIQ